MRRAARWDGANRAITAGDDFKELRFITTVDKKGQRWAFCESDNFGERAGGRIHRIVAVQVSYTGVPSRLTWSTPVTFPFPS